ncbi:neutral ceramidase isoform X1 [Amborella trichopoda]|nr:neutral ceramidase isoform X1 [Amborella trichopoda]|eukprot:XP_020517299.1 neutral ceramidase isoform X1 [Amborella trichopoda]
MVFISAKILQEKLCQLFLLVSLLSTLILICGASRATPKADLATGDYLVGVGSYDMTGPAADVNMMGYANMGQVASGIHFRLRARTLIVAQGFEGPRIAFVNLDAGMASQLVTIKVLERLKTRYGNVYTQDNVAISGTHTHSAPGGYLQYLLYVLASMGFSPQCFDAMENAIEESIVQAHNTLAPASLLINKGDVENAGINRSPSAYLFNPAQERAKYPQDVDPEMTLLKLVDQKTGAPLGAFSWFATHGTSMTKENKLISGDNKGAAARFFEDWFTTHEGPSPTSPSPNPGEVFFFLSESNESIAAIKATGGEACNNETSRQYRVRKSQKFVGAFCQSNVGDVSPNVLGTICIDSGTPCDFNHSSCNGNNLLCVGRGPGYPDEISSTKIIGERQFQKAVDLFTTAKDQISGKVDYRHVYVNFTNIAVELESQEVVNTCPAALGPGFAAGTTDGGGIEGFQQGDTKISEKWRRTRDSLHKPSQSQIDCHKPKAILLDVGEMFEPYQWAPAILPIQILRIGQLVILAVPGELTTMAGRRIREAVKDTLVNQGKGEFDENTHVLIAGLANTYSQYITTFEEYQQQRYEAASTLFGPHTLSAYIQEFNKLAASMAIGENIGNEGPSPPDLSSVELILVKPPTGDRKPSNVNFGDVKKDVGSDNVKRGQIVSATFWSGNPRNDLLTEGTFAAVEMLSSDQKTWVPAYDDDDFSLIFKWSLENTTDSGLATIQWEIPQTAALGVYRLRHFGSAKSLTASSLEYFTGTSSSFKVS